jgi:hypothetical protein
MAVTNSITGALVKLVVVVIVVSVALGITMSGTDLLNPKTSAARQREMDAATQHQVQLDALQEQQLTEQIRHQAQNNLFEEQKLAAKNQLDVEYHERKVKLGLELFAIREYVLTAAAALSLLIVSIGVSVLLFRLGQRWAKPPRHAFQGEVAWQALADRNARILAAWARERQFREAFAQPATQGQTVPGEDGRHREPALWSEQLEAASGASWGRR